MCKEKFITFPFQLCFINIIKNREVSRRHRGKGKAGLPQRVFKLLYPPVRIERTMGIIHHLFPFVKAFSENSFLKFFRIVRVFIYSVFLLLLASVYFKGAWPSPPWPLRVHPFERFRLLQDKIMFYCIKIQLHPKGLRRSPEVSERLCASGA